MTISAELPVPAVAAASPPPRRRSGGAQWHRSKGLGFVLPFLVCFAAVFLAPLGYAAWTSLFRTRLVGGTVFAGLQNYRDVLTDPEFRDGVLRMLRFLVTQVPVMLVLAVGFALAIDSGRLWGQRFVRLSIFLPYAVPSVVAALMWGYIYGPTFGPVTQIAHKLGAGAPDLLGDRWMLTSLANIVSWEFIGYNMIIFYAALRAIPPELYEAAAVDGAGAVRTALHIKLPALRPALALTAIFSVIGTFQLFTEPSIMHTVAPNVINRAYTPAWYAYNLAFTDQRLNYAAALSFALGAVIIVATAIFLLAVRRWRARA
jgi:multiple sugar transport system permease protein